MKTDRKKTSIIILLILSITVFPGCSFKNMLKECSFQFKNIEINGMDFGSNELKGKITLKVTNPNWISLNIKSLKCKVFMDKKELLQGNIDDSVRLPANENVEIEIPFSASYSNLSLGDIKSLLKDKRKVSISGEALLGSFFINIPVTFEVKKNIKKLI